MADIRIKDLTTTASQTSSGDFIAIDGLSNGTRKLSATAPAFLTSVTTPSLTSPASTNLTLAGGAGNSSIILTPAGTGNVGIGTTSPSYRLSLLANTSTTVGTQTAIEIISSDGLTLQAGQTLIAAQIDSATPGDRGTALTFSTARQGVGLTENFRIASTGTVSIASSTAGSASAGALVVTGGLATGAASYFGGAVTASNGITLGSGKLLLGGNGEILAGQDSGGYYFANGAGATTNVPINIGDAASLQVFRTSASAAAGSRRLVLGPAGTFGIGGTITNTATMLGAAISYDNTTVAVNTAATFAGTVSPQQATTAAAPAYVKGAIYFDTTLNKLRVGGATAWETITSV